jgi:5-methylcytosine-specific restriction endonuclease McrA
MVLAKPSRLARDVAKWERRMSAAERKAIEDRAERAAWQTVSALVKARDGYRCRVCSMRTTRMGCGDPRRWAHVHHIVYRSAGGGSYPRNLILLCGRCHDDEHQHRIVIAGTADALTVAPGPNTEAI